MLQKIQLTLWLEEHPARTCPREDSAQGGSENDLDSHGVTSESSKSTCLDGSSGKMSKAQSEEKTEKDLSDLSKRLTNSGSVFHGVFLMQDISAAPKDAHECSLLEVFETNVADRYFLSQKAKSGLIRRQHSRPCLFVSLQGVQVVSMTEKLTLLSSEESDT